MARSNKDVLLPPYLYPPAGLRICPVERQALGFCVDRPSFCGGSAPRGKAASAGSSRMVLLGATQAFGRTATEPTTIRRVSHVMDGQNARSRRYRS